MLPSTFDPHKPLRYVRYARMSSDLQNERSPDQQFDTIDATLRRLGYAWVHCEDYRDDGSVHAAVKLQELFGLAETPRVGPRREPVTFSPASSHR